MTSPEACSASPRGRWRPPGPESRFALLFGLAGITLGTSAVLTLQHPAPTLWQVTLALLLLVPGLLLQLPARLGAQRITIDGFYEAALIVTLAHVRQAWIVLLVAGIVAVREARKGRAFLRAATNVSVQAVPLAAGLLLLSVLPPAPGVAGWPLLVLAVLVVAVLNELLVDTVMASATGTTLLAVLRRDARSGLLALGGNLVLGLASLAAVAGRRWELLVLLPVAVVLLLRKGRRGLQEETLSDALPRVVRAAQRLESESEDELVQEVLRRTADMFGLRRAELVLVDWPGAGDRTTALLTDGTLRTTSGRPTRETPGNVLVRALVTGRTVPVAFGELRLHFPTSPSLSRPEEQILETLVRTCASALSRARAHLEQSLAARRDHLTGLANRLELQEQLDTRLPALLDRRAADPSSPGMALMLVDLDHFKEVNDTLGHSAGDRVLVELASRLVKALRPDDVVVRLGGDEFALLLVDIDDRATALTIAEAVLRRLSAPVVVDGLELPVEASVGVALAPDDGTYGDDLLRRADIAMYRAKGERNAVVVFDAAMDSGREEQMHLLGQLQTALRTGQIVVHYQPIVSLADGRVMGAEALVRWEHPEQGLIGPGAFVPAAERTELVVPLTLAVLEQAVQEATQWRVPGGTPVTLSVNLSPRCLLDRTLPQEVMRILARHGLPGRRLLLEITETLALSELEVVEEVLLSLRDLGVRLSLDDFGTGFSSMSALRRLAVHEVKIDRSFVSDAVGNRGARAIVEATVTLAHGLGVPVVGEGVETAEQLDLLRTSGCDRAQGYLLGRPVDAVAFRARLLEPPALPSHTSRTLAR